MSTKPLLKESLFILNMSGLNPLNRNMWSKMRAITMIGLLIPITFDLVLQLISNWRGWDSVNEFIVCAGITQVLSKFLFMILKSEDVMIAINSVEQFWAWGNLPIGLHGQIQQILGRTMKCIKLFGISFFVCLIVYSLKPFFTLPVRTLPFDTFHPTDRNISPNYQIMYSLQVIWVTLCVFCVLGFDSLFVSLMVYAICQLKILKQKFSNLKVNAQVKGDKRGDLEGISSLVGHHDFVLGYIQNINNVYSTFFLSQFSSSIVCICCGLLNMAASDFPPDAQRWAGCISFLLCGSSQLFIYCFVGELLMAESENLSDAVFGSDWWVNPQPKTGKAYVLIIQRAQKAEKLSAGGMFTLNLQSFTSIMKFALSFFAMAQAMYSRTDNQAIN